MGKDAATVWRERARKAGRELLTAPAETQVGLMNEFIDSVIQAAVYEARDRAVTGREEGDKRRQAE